MNLTEVMPTDLMFTPFAQLQNQVLTMAEAPSLML